MSASIFWRFNTVVYVMKNGFAKNKEEKENWKKTLGLTKSYLESPPSLAKYL